MAEKIRGVNMEQKQMDRAEALVNVIKKNLLKPMYEGIINNCNSEVNKLTEKINSIEQNISEMKHQQESFFKAINDLKWDD